MEYKHDVLPERGGLGVLPQEKFANFGAVWFNLGWSYMLDLGSFSQKVRKALKIFSQLGIYFRIPHFCERRALA